MTSSRTTRTPLSGSIEASYLYRVDAPYMGLYNVDSLAMTVIPELYWDAADPTNFARFSDRIDLGFTFRMNDVDYSSVQVSMNGWLLLVDPTTVGNVSEGDVVFGSYESFNYGGFSDNKQHLLLAPWAQQARAVSENDQFQTPVSERTTYGFEPPRELYSYNQSRYGVRRAFRNDPRRGQCFIVRWHVELGGPQIFASASDEMFRTTFDCVIYEDGTVEFRYGPKPAPTTIYDVQASNTTERASFIMASGSALPRFRDVSYEFGLDTSERERYPLGGTLWSAGYTASPSGRPYGAALSVTDHWFHGGFVFQSPTNRKKVLKSDVHVADYLSQTPKNFGVVEGTDRSFFEPFDDRNTVTYEERTVNLPTSLPAFFGAPDWARINRQNVFSGDFESVGVTTKAGADGFVGRHNTTLIRPFSDVSVDQAGSTGSYYVSGSNPTQYLGSLTHRLASKTQIKLSFPVEYKTRMLPSTASLYYYDAVAKMWLIPPNQTFVSQGASSASSPPASFMGSDLKSIENQQSVAWSPTGVFLSSASFTEDINERVLTDVLQSFDWGKIGQNLGYKYEKTITINQDYNANNTIKIPINRSFLLEKAEIEIPVAAGQNWFADKTTTFPALMGASASVGFDDAVFLYAHGGPGLTVGLSHQFKTGSSARDYRRNLIMSGTITHAADDVSEIELRTVESAQYVNPPQLVIASGFRAHNAKPTCVITADGTNTFTGSVKLRCESAVLNGVMARFVVRHNDDRVDSSYSQFKEALTNPFIYPGSFSNNGSFGTNFLLGGLSPFGRAKVGLEIDARTVFGKEFAASFPQAIPNPLYISPDVFDSYVSSGSFPQEAAYASIPIVQNVQSPYLLQPGDELVLSIAKSCPISGSTVYVPGFDAELAPFDPGIADYSGLGHDFTLETGSINITLYGSEIKDGVEFHDTLNQQVGTAQIHEVVGNEPVVDTFYGSFRGAYVGTYTDDIVMGDLVSASVDRSGLISYSTGSRAKVVSKVNARASYWGVYGAPGFSNIGSVTVTDYDPNAVLKGLTSTFLLTPWYTRAGAPSIATHFSTERFYDSLIPSFPECAKRYGKPLLKDTSVDRANVYLPSHYTGTLNPILERVFHLQWVMSFPFEPMFDGVEKLRSMNKSITVFDLGTNPNYTIQKEVRHVTIHLYHLQGGEYESTEYADYKVSGSYVQAHAFNAFWNDEGTTKALYGYGTFRNEYATDKHLPGYLVSGPGTAYGPQIEGWKYGLVSGFATYSRSHYRRDRFGQLRDQLEQRLDTKFTDDRGNVSSSPVTVKFLDGNGRSTEPANTWSSNLSFEATSSRPYFDGLVKNRGDIDLNALNKGIVTLSPDPNGNLTF